MKVIKLSRFVEPKTHLLYKSDALLLFEAIKQELETEEKVILDFSDVIISETFTRGFLTYLIQEFGYEEMNKRILIKNISNLNREIIRDVLINVKQVYSAK